MTAPPAYRLNDTYLEPGDVLHIKYQSLPGRLHGVGPMEWSYSNLVNASALDEYATSIAQHGVWAVLKHPGNLNAKQAADMKANWQTQRAADPSAPAVLSGGIEFEALSISPKDMALLDLRVMSDQRIAAAFGVPPFLIGVENPGGMTYNTTSSLFELHWRQTLRPTASTFAEHLSAWALPNGRGMEFDRERIHGADAHRTIAGVLALHGTNIDDETGPAVSESKRSNGYLHPQRFVSGV